MGIVSKLLDIVSKHRHSEQTIDKVSKLHSEQASDIVRKLQA